jgi:hypothetical protein
MRVVYLYLVKQVARSAEKLAFRCITPIFTHADFYVHPSDQGGPADAAFWLRAYSRPAYHRYDYFYNPAKIDEPVDEFFFEMQSEIDLYYSTSNDTREESIAWQSVATSVDRLTEEETPWLRRNPLGALHRGTRIRLLDARAITPGLWPLRPDNSVIYGIKSHPRRHHQVPIEPLARALRP